MNLTDRVRNGLVLVTFAIVFTGLCVNSYRQKSATWDEPQHVVRASSAGAATTEWTRNIHPFSASGLHYGRV